MKFLLNIFLKLIVLVLVIALYVSFDGMVNRTMSNTFSLKKLSYFDTIQMVEEEIENENEVEILNLIEVEEVFVIISPLILLSYDFEYLKLRRLFFPGAISPPP